MGRDERVGASMVQELPGRPAVGASSLASQTPAECCHAQVCQFQLPTQCEAVGLSWPPLCDSVSSAVEWEHPGVVVKLS